VAGQAANYTAITKVVHGCGKTATVVYVPPTATDLSPFVLKAANMKPDFVVTNVAGTQAVQAVQEFSQDGIPPSKISVPDSDFTAPVLTGAGKVLDGVVTIFQFDPWDLSSDPEVAAYLSAMKGSSVDPRNGNVEWGYSDVMALYNAAKQIGFNSFTSATLANYLGHQANVPLPLSRELVNPGPTVAPQEKQPYARLYQWNGSSFVLVPAGSAKDGWVQGWV
jgi:ABC-type branched-subunit amino acid transport system substrate-binding protein